MANHQYGPGQESALVVRTFHVTCSASLALFSLTLCHLESTLKRPDLVAYRHHSRAAARYEAVSRIARRESLVTELFLPSFLW